MWFLSGTMVDPLAAFLSASFNYGSLMPSLHVYTTSLMTQEQLEKVKKEAAQVTGATA